jgi:hypothetical protein
MDKKKRKYLKSGKTDKERNSSKNRKNIKENVKIKL